eukprot:15060095-Alexandrium_andersonii.AAC.1
MLLWLAGGLAPADLPRTTRRPPRPLPVPSAPCSSQTGALMPTTTMRWSFTASRMLWLPAFPFARPSPPS